MTDLGLTVAATAMLCLLIGVLVGVWLRGRIPQDSTVYTGATPSEPPQTPPTSTPILPFPGPGAVSTTRPQPHSYRIILADSAGVRLATATVSRRAAQVFHGDHRWEHYGEAPDGTWLYRPTEALTRAQRRSLINPQH